MRDVFPVVVLIGRPAAGKSEVIDFLKRCDPADRARRFHIGPFVEIDDFPYIWDWFEEDDILERHGRPRLHTDSDYYFRDEFLWNVCIEKINLAFRKRMRDMTDGAGTAIVEFARGGENGFGEAFSYLSDEILERAAIAYIRVSYAESVRRNRKRARKGLEDSILHHSLPDDKMEHYYRINDWDRIAPGDDGWLQVRQHRVPYAVVSNEPEVTHDDGLLGQALESTFGRLWMRWDAR